MDSKPKIAVMSFPNRVIAGPGALARLGDEVARLGGTSVLIVSDRGIARAGLIDRVEAVLQSKGIAFARFLEVSKNPIERDVLTGVEAYQAQKADLVIGLGGGAALDVAKAIRLKVTHPLPLIEYDDDIGGDQKISADQPPIICIPTTAGTGSEVGRSSVIALGEGAQHRKVVIFSPFMLPNVALLDAELTVGLPPEITAATGIDALTHALEAYVSTGTNPFADAFALASLARISLHLRTAVTNGADLRARHEMLLASAMGAISFQKGLGACHSLAHPLSAVADVHHGLANAIMLPYVIAYNLESAPGAYARAAQALGAEGFAPRQCLQIVEALIADLPLARRLSEVGVEAAHIPAMVQQAIGDAAHRSNPRPFDADAAERLYRAAL